MLVWAVFGLLAHFAIVSAGLGATASVVLLFVLFALLGWKTFGPPLHS